ncbi:MAG TPA: hypothetical protein DCS93_04440 [Microscillaceae bacterium]|nr:hypothetical protein [Microscillaceae bacterium]
MGSRAVSDTAAVENGLQQIERLNKKLIEAHYQIMDKLRKMIMTNGSTKQRLRTEINALEAAIDTYEESKLFITRIIETLL